jgi:hypothetical protein
MTGKSPANERRPLTFDGLIAAVIEARDQADPVATAALCPALIEFAKAVCALERGAHMYEATIGPDRITQTEVAERLQVHPNKVGALIKAYLSSEEARRGDQA